MTPEKFVSGKISMFVLTAQNEKLSFPAPPPENQQQHVHLVVTQGYQTAK